MVRSELSDSATIYHNLLKQKVANRYIASRTVWENLLFPGAALDHPWSRITRAVVKRFSSAYLDLSWLHSLSTATISTEILLRQAD